MTRIVPSPPPALDSARVIEYAVLEKSVTYSGHSSLYVDGKELGPVPCLAICQIRSEAGVLLFHCSSDWTVLGAADYASVAEAKNRAECIYPGVSAHWIETRVTEQEAERYLEEVWKDRQCSVCGKRANQIQRLVSKNDVRLCDRCITEFYQMLHEGS